ncbi:hypothetical protein [Rhizobium sp. 21-4511-3d]
MLKYPEKQPHFLIAGSYRGWISASKQENGRSAVSVELEDREGSQEPYRFAASGADTDSTEQRAYLRGLVDLCEAVPPHSEIEVCCDSNYPGFVIRLSDEWKRKGWKNSGGKVANPDIIEQYHKVRDERNLKITSRNSSSNDRIRLDRLKVSAHALAKQ